MSEKLIEVKNLKKYFKLNKKDIKAVDDVSFYINKGETFGLVGESGSGKSTLGRTVTRLYEPTEGSIFYKNDEISNLKGKNLKKYQKNMQIIFQDPYSSLNPYMTVKEILTEPIKIHTNLNKDEIDKKMKELLEAVGLPMDSLFKYPHEFSGGQRQRIGIARALSVDPEFVLCDEPISALDVSVQAQVVNTLKQIQQDTGVTYLFVAHDLTMVKYISHRIGVMYLGKLVEIGEVNEIYNNAKHPYSKLLLNSVPKIGSQLIAEDDVYNKDEERKGCPFAFRCKDSMSKCFELSPSLKDISADKEHLVACHLY